MSNIIIPTEFASPGIARPIDDSCVLQTISRGSRQKGTKVFDLSKKGNHGTIYGAVWKTLPSGLNVLKFDGVDDYVDCGSDESLNITDEITLEAWVKTSETGTQKTIIVKDLSGYGPGYLLRIQTNNKPNFFIGDGANPRDVSTISKTVTDGIWHYIVGVWEGDLIKIYLDGYLDNVANASGVGDIRSNTDVLIGRRISNYYFHGLIDEVRIYNRALSASEIREHFENERILFGV